MAYTYDPIFAADPNNPEVVAANASITIFDPNDPARTPVTITDVTGSPLPNPITVNAKGFGPAFQHATLDRVGWFGATFENYFTAYEGMKNEAVAARQAAESAAGNAAAAAQADLESRIAAGAFKGAPGKDGKDGLNGSNVLPTDDAIEQAIKTAGTKTVAALSATIVQRAGSVLHDVVGKIETNAQNVSLLFITDSTGTYDQNTWTSQIPAGLAAKYPKHTIIVRTWNYTTGTSWNAATTYATGTGTRTITVWMGGAPGQNWPYFFDVSRRAAFFGGPGQTPDAVFLSMGHNDPTVDTADLTRPHIDRAKLHIERYRLMLPHAVFVLVSQNPTTATKKWSEANADSYRRIAAQRGYGFIDANRVFLDYAGPITDLVPAADLHPTAAGYTLWANRVLAEFVSQTGARNAAQALPALSVAGKSVLTRVTAPIASNGWTLSNVTETTEATIVDRRAQSVKLTKTASGTGAQAWIPLPNFVRGQSVFVVVHMYIPAASYVNTGQVQIREASATKTTAIVPNYLRDQWADVVVSWDIPHTAPASPNGYRLYINVDPQGGTELPTLYLEDVSVFVGDYPLDPVY